MTTITRSLHLSYSCILCYLQISKIAKKSDNDSDSDDDDDDRKEILANIPKAVYTGNDYCKDDSHKYQLNGWSLAGAQRIKALTALVVKNRLEYSRSFDRRMRKFVELKRIAQTNKSKKRKKAICPGDVIVIQSDLDLDPAAMFPDHNANDFNDENDALMQLDDDVFE